MAYTPEYCPNCGKVLVPIPKSGMLTCKKCKYEKPKTASSSFISKTEQKKSEMPILEGNIQLLPTTNAKCKECGNNTAYWEMKQTRGADESPTLFLICTKCRFRWRKYE